MDMNQVRKMYLGAQRQFTKAECPESLAYWRGKVDAYYSVWAISQKSARKSVKFGIISFQMEVAP